MPPWTQYSYSVFVLFSIDSGIRQFQNQIVNFRAVQVDSGGRGAVCRSNACLRKIKIERFLDNQRLSNFPWLSAKVPMSTIHLTIINETKRSLGRGTATIWGALLILTVCSAPHSSQTALNRQEPSAEYTILVHLVIVCTIQHHTPLPALSKQVFSVQTGQVQIEQKSRHILYVSYRLNKCDKRDKGELRPVAILRVRHKRVRMRCCPKVCHTHTHLWAQLTSRILLLLFIPSPFMKCYKTVTYTSNRRSCNKTRLHPSMNGVHSYDTGVTLLKLHSP